MNGTTNVTTGCGVFDNSNAADAINIVGGGNITTTGGATTDIVGNWSGSGTISPSPRIGQAVMSDPFADMTPPPYSGCDYNNINLHNSQSRSLTPGVICNGLSLNAQSSVTLAPGTYIIKGGLDMGGQTSISGTGVTLYIESGSVSMAGGATVSLSAPTTGAYKEFCFIRTRTTLATPHWWAAPASR
jgi:hypothetical protein